MKSTLSADQPHLQLTPTRCCLCEGDDSKVIATGEDFEYHTSPDEFTAKQCRLCGLVFLDPRPEQEFERIYPAHYHAFDFSEQTFGLVYTIRQRLEAKRLLAWCRGLPDTANIIDVGCGDGFHLKLLRDYGHPGWQLDGVDADERAAAVARRQGLTVHCGLLEHLDLPSAHYDLALLIQTIEHVADPPQLFRDIYARLKPGGQLVVVTDNIDSLDFKLFKSRHWGGYHFPRHWNLFNQRTMRLLAEESGFQVERLTTAVSPVNWVYSIRNLLVDKNAPSWLIDQFSLNSTASLSLFTVLDGFNRFRGAGALLNAVLKRPE